MKTLLTTLFLAAALLCSGRTGAQEKTVSQEDTVNINFLLHVSPGDILPFKYIYQRARIGEDTSITLSITKNITFEVLENNRKDKYVLFNIIQSDFKKEGPESLDPGYSRTTFVAEGYPVEITVYYDGTMDGVSDTLMARAERNKAFVADTLSRHLGTENISKEELMGELSFLTDTSYVMSSFASDLNSLFLTCGYDLVPNITYSSQDSIMWPIDNQKHILRELLVLDEEFARENPDYNDLYVVRSASQMDTISTIGVTFLADKTIGLPFLVQKEMVDNYYDHLGDNLTSVIRTVIILDVDKLVSIQEKQEDEEEENEDEEPRYDDYGFIKVK